MLSRLFFSILLAALLLPGCRSRADYTSRPAKSILHPDNDLLEMNAVAWHQNDSMTTVYLEVLNDNLLYKRPDTTMSFFANVKVTYRLLNEVNGRKILDTGSVYLSDRSSSEVVHSKPLHSRFQVLAKQGSNYFLEIEAIDLNKKVRYTRGLSLYRQSAQSAQNYLVLVNDSVVFRNNFQASQKVVVRLNHAGTSPFIVDCFRRQAAAALPPFSSKEDEKVKYEPDSTYKTTPENGMLELVMPSRGYLHIRTSDATMEGLTLFIFDDGYPGVGDADEMIASTRYIMNKEEFEKAQTSADKKAAIDQFWLTLGGSNERARELLRRYYNRVVESNKFFSSWMEGWKTDRGMIFIVFGPPTNTYRSRKDEVWVYGNEANPATLRFVFNRVQNPFTENDFVMERSPFYRDIYYSAVDMWRQGTVYIETRR